MKQTIDSLKFDNRVLRSLPIDKETRNYVRQVKGAIFSKVNPTPLENPQIVSIARPVAEMLNLELEESKDVDLAAYLSGNKLIPGSECAAHCYCGHQFGSFAGQLGDGAAIYLGEVVNPASGNRFEIQLKGAGLTPYSRSADGRKVLRSSIREFLCSEAIHGLGIPTTRALSLVTSDTLIARDPLYSGNVVQEKASVVCRVAESFLRFGSFEIFKKTDERTGMEGPSSSDEIRDDLLPRLANFVMDSYYPQVNGNVSFFFDEVVRRTASLVAHWHTVGFCHGVLNTDNMSILGLTIDYGPFGFLDYFDYNHVCNGSDDSGRYSYANQPSICKWNCLKLGEALHDLLPEQDLISSLEKFDEVYSHTFHELMRRKLGFLDSDPVNFDDEMVLFKELFDAMESTSSDYTLTFRAFADLSKETALEKILDVCLPLELLIQKYRPRISPRGMAQLLDLKTSNPQIFESIGADKILSQELNRAEMRKTLSTRSESDHRASNRQIWSSWLDKCHAYLDLSTFPEERLSILNKSNPKIVLRNWMAQRAISAAESGDFSEVNNLLEILSNPYIDHPNIDPEYLSTPPEWSSELCVTCSS
jgi:uncharacterized protein YdiU (UPF0061 family)